MQKFEYLILNAETSGWMTQKVDWEALGKKLNTLGEQGWELVSQIDPQSNGYSGKMGLIFKRPL